MKLISAIEAVKMMDDYKGHGFVHVRTSTKPSFIGYKRDASVLPAFRTATGCDHPDDVQKYAEYNAQLGLSYGDLIEKRLVSQGKDTTEYERGETWHEPVDGGSRNLRQHKRTKEKYFFLFLTANTFPTVRYVDSKKGTEIAKDAIKPFLAKKSAPKNQGLTPGTEVEVQTLKLESLVSIKLASEEYLIR